MRKIQTLLLGLFVYLFSAFLGMSVNFAMSQKGENQLISAAAKLKQEKKDSDKDFYKILKEGKKPNNKTQKKKDDNRNP